MSRRAAGAPRKPNPETPRPNYWGVEYPASALAFFERFGFRLEPMSAQNQPLVRRGASGQEIARVVLARGGAVLGRCPQCRGPARSETPLVVLGMAGIAGHTVPGDWYAICQRCDRLVRAKLIRAVLRRDIPCSPKCSGATGQDCTCSCGGQNHGGRYSG